MKISLPTTSPLTSKDFVYGVATSSFQIEGAAEKREISIWDTFCDTPGKIVDASNGLVACDHYHLWEQDINLIHDLGVDAYRFSICWPRIINNDKSVNRDGVDFYLKVLDKLNELGIKPFVTLYHWDLPQIHEDHGGWLNRETAYHFRDYVEVVVREFGDRVHSYATLNEPFCSAYLGYEVGIHAPGKADRMLGRKAAHHLLLAHGLAMQVLAKESPLTLNGIVLNFTPCYPLTDSPEDKLATQKADDYINQWYMKPIMDGSYPSLIEELPYEQRPDILDDDLAIINHPIDFLGINFYTRLKYRAKAGHLYEEIPPGDVEKTDIGWEVFPQALTDLLVSLNDTYDLPPLYITENGMAGDDHVESGQVKDQLRINYYQAHLEALNQAIQQGVKVDGYFAWSLMDNFEWAEGYLKRFGLVYVDFETQERTLKDSAHCYKEFITQRV